MSTPIDEVIFRLTSNEPDPIGLVADALITVRELKALGLNNTEALLTELECIESALDEQDIATPDPTFDDDTEVDVNEELSDWLSEMDEVDRLTGDGRR